MKQHRAARQPAKPAIEFALLTVMLLVVLPIAWLVFQAFLPDRAIVSRNWDLSFWLGNFALLFEPGRQFSQQLLNSLVLTLCTVGLCLAIGSAAGYSLSRLDPPRWITLPALLVAALLTVLPPMSLISGLYLTLRSFGLFGSLLGLILLNTLFNLPFSVLLMKSYFDQVPEELREAALIDGAGEFRTFFSVMLPLVRPGLAAVGIYAGIMAWNEFLFGLTMTSGGSSAPLTVGIASLVQPYEVTWGEMSAAGVLAAAPVIILAALANRSIVAGLTSGAIKG